MAAAQNTLCRRQLLALIIQIGSASNVLTIPNLAREASSSVLPSLATIIGNHKSRSRLMPGW